MASDNLNQLGKSLRQTQDNADYALKRQRPDRPSVERTRDIFDPTVPFTMYFTVAPKQKRLVLDMEFNKPPPMSECMGSPCRMACETFDGLSSGDHELQTSDAYTTGLTAVYVNGATYSSTKWAEINPDTGTVLVTQLPLTTNTVTICYMRECAETYDCSDILAHGGTTGQPIRYDVFGAYMLSGGACNHYVPPFLDTSVATNFCYHGGPNGNGLIDSYGEGDDDVNNSGPIQPFGSPNNGDHWGMPATVWGGGYSAGHWTFSFPGTRLCGAFVNAFGGFPRDRTTVDYAVGDWDTVDGSFGDGAVIQLAPVVTDTITLHWEYSASPGLQYYGGVRFTTFMVWGKKE